MLVTVWCLVNRVIMLIGVMSIGNVLNNNNPPTNNPVNASDDTTSTNNTITASKDFEHNFINQGPVLPEQVRVFELNKTLLHYNNIEIRG